MGLAQEKNLSNWYCRKLQQQERNLEQIFSGVSDASNLFSHKNSEHIPYTHEKEAYVHGCLYVA